MSVLEHKYWTDMAYCTGTSINTLCKEETLDMVLFWKSNQWWSGLKQSYCSEVPLDGKKWSYMVRFPLWTQHESGRLFVFVFLIWPHQIPHSEKPHLSEHFPNFMGCKTLPECLAWWLMTTPSVGECVYACVCVCMCVCMWIKPAHSWGLTIFIQTYPCVWLIHIPIYIYIWHYSSDLDNKLWNSNINK